MTSLSLNRSIVFGDVILTDYPYMSEFGMDYAAGDLVTSVLSSFLQDGDLEMSQRRGNMTLTIPLLIEGTDLLELAQAEAALAVEAQKPTNTLTINPGDGYGPATVFDTFEADVSFSFDDKLEQAAMRRLVLTIRALPFGRSATEVVTAGVVVPASPTSATISDGSTTTGWSGTNGGVPVTVTTDGSLVAESGSIAGGPLFFNLTYTAAIDLTSTRLIYVDWTADFPTSGVRASVGSGGSQTAVPEYATITAAGTGYNRSYFQVPTSFGNTASSVTFAVLYPASLSGSGTVRIDAVVRTDTRPGIGTQRQQVRTIAVPGSARTQGSLLTQSAAGLGDVLQYTYPPTDQLTPALRQFYVSGSGFATNAALCSGAQNTLSGPVSFGIPARLMQPGLYLILARVAAPGGSLAVTLSWSAQTKVGGVNVGRLLTGSVTVVLSPTYAFRPLAEVDLPPVGVNSGTTAMVEIAVSGTSSVTLDDVYLLNLSTGRLAMVACGSGAASPGGPSSRLWTNAAAVTPGPTVLRGNAADGTDAWFAGDNIVTAGVHELTPPAVKVFTVTTAATDAQVSLRHYPRWLGHAAS